jgi:Glycosyltransferase family 87
LFVNWIIATVSVALVPRNVWCYIRHHRAWFIVAVAAAAYYPRFVKLPAGMETYPRAAACLWDGLILQACDPGFTYPPFFALVMLPFAPMPLWLRDLVWYVVTLAATIGAVKLSEFITRKAVATPLDRVELCWLRFFTLLLSAKLILAVFENQAYDALVAVSVLVGLAGLSGGRTFTAGAGLALAAALKATPLIFLPYLLWKRHFAAAVSFVVVYAVASLLPDILFAPAGAHGYFSTWLHEVVEPSLGFNPASAPFAFWNGANILNHSLHGAVALNIDEATQHTMFDATLASVDGCFIAVVGALLALSPRRPESIAIDGSLLLIAMLMLSPMTSRSHYVALLLPYATLVALNLRDKNTASRGRAVLGVSFSLVTLAGNDAVGQAFTVWAYRHSAMVMGTLVLLIYFAALVIERRHRPMPGRSKNPVAVMIGLAQRVGDSVAFRENRLLQEKSSASAELNGRYF